MTREEAEKRLEAAKEDLAGAEKALATLALDGGNLALAKELAHDLRVRVFSRTVDLAEATLAAKAPNPAQDATEARSPKEEWRWIPELTQGEACALLDRLKSWVSSLDVPTSTENRGSLSAQNRALLEYRDEEWCQALWAPEGAEGSVTVSIHYDPPEAPAQ